MPSDTPTPAEIAAQIMNSKSFDGAKWHDIDTPDIIHILGVLAEHYHLLPRAESQESPHHTTVKWLDGEVQAAKGKGVVRLYVEDSRNTPDDARELASALASAADVAEEPK